MATFRSIRRQTTLFVQAASEIHMLPSHSPLRPHRVLERHADWVSSLAFSPDETHVATGSGDGTVLIWNLQSGSYTNLGGHTGFVRSVSFSSDGRRLATGGYDSRVCIWDVVSHALLCTLPAEHDSRAVAFSPDGRQVASVGDESVKIWNTKTSNVLHSLNGKGQWTLAYTPDGSMLAFGSGNSITIWTPKSNIIYELLGHTGPVLSVAFTPSADQLVSGSADGTIRRWNIKTRKSIGEPLIGHIGTVLSVSISPSGHMIASGGQDKTLRVWDAVTGKTTSRVFQHPDWVRCVKFSPNGKYIASACDDKKARLWHVRMHTKTSSASMEKRLSDALGDSDLDVDELSERFESGKPPAILASPTSTANVSVRFIDELMTLGIQRSLSLQLSFTLPSKEQAQTQSGNGEMSEVPLKVPPRLQESAVLSSQPPLRDNTGKRKLKITTWVIRAVFHRFRDEKRSVNPSEVSPAIPS